MKNFQTVVQELLHNHERQRRYIALLTALCMLMAFTVSIILIEPAESMTGELACGMSEHIHNENCFTYTCGLEDDENHVHSAECRTLTCGKTEHAHSENCYIEENGEMSGDFMQISSPEIFDSEPEGDSPSGDENISPQNGDVQVMDSGEEDDEYFKEVLENYPSDAVPFPDLSNVSVTVNDVAYKNSETIETDLDELDNVKFYIEYALTKDTVSVEQPYIYYQLPKGIILPPNLCGITRYVSAEGYSGSAGYYSISESGLIVIRFTKKYIQEKIQNADGKVPGNIEFSGTIERDNTKSGDRNLQFGEENIVVKFPDKEGYDVSKSGKIVRPSTADQDIQIEWTIKLNSFDNTSFANGVVSDEKFANIADKNSIIIEPDDLGTWDGNEYHFNENVQDSVNQVTFTYKETITKQEFKDRYEADYDYEESNTATLNVGGSSYSDTDTVTFNETPSITKNYKADYLNKKGYNHKIDWSIVVEHPYGTSLSGYKVKDSAFEGLDSTKITIKDKNGNLLNYDSDYTFDSIAGTIEFKKDISQATITYTTDVENTTSTVEIPNSAELIPPNTYTGGKKFNSSVTAKYEDVQKLSDKKGNYNPDTKKITWSVGATVTEENNYNSYPDITLDGYTITDPAFEGLDFTKLSDIKASCMEERQWNNRDLVVSKCSENEIEFDNGAKLTLNGDTITVSGAIGKFSFNYTTDYVEGTTETKTDGEDSIPYVENEITDKWGHKEVGKAKIVSRNETHKTLLNTPDLHYAGTGAEESAITETLNWQIDLIKDEGFSGNDLRDAVSASVAGGNSATVTHYIDLNSIKVYYSTDGSDFTHQLDESYYTVNPTTSENVTEFTISFDEQVKSAGYHYIRVKYNSIVTMTPPEGGWDSVEFGEDGKIYFSYENTANTDTVDGKITIQDYDYVPKTNVNVIKTWLDNGVENDTPPEGIKEIKFYLQRRKESDSADTGWKIIYSNNDGENWLESESEDFSEHLFTLSGENWSMNFDTLPSETPDHSQKYYYRAVEVDVPEGYSATYNYETNGVQSGDFKIKNQKDAYLVKKALDKDDSVIPEGTEINVNQLKPIEIDGVKYYGIKYRVDLINFSNTEGNFILTDTIPDGFRLAYKETTYDDGNIPDYQPHHYVNEYRWQPYWWKDSQGVISGKFDVDGNKINFGVDSTINYIDYTLIIPVNSVGTSGKLVNNTISTNGKEASSSITITGGTETPDVEEADLLKKTINNGTSDEKYNAFDGEISYSLYVNPEGNDISNSNEYDIHDVLSLIGLDSNSDPQEVMAKILAGNLKISVQEISNYSEDESGRITADVVRTLIPGEYSYNIDYSSSTSEKKTLDIKLTKETWGQYDTSGEENSPAIPFPVIYKLKVKGNPSESFTLNKQQYQYDEKGECIVTIINNEGYPYGGNYWFVISSGDDVKNVESIELLEAYYNKITYNSSADLTITVPDGMPLKITYSYTISDSKEGTLKTGETVFTAKNEVSLTTKNVSSTDERTATFNYLYNDEAHIGVNNLPKLVKYNVGNQGESLSADFYIAVYDNGEWKFSNKNDYTTEDNARKYEFNFSVSATGRSIPEGAVPFQLDGSSNIENYLTLDTKKLYKLIEVKVPTDATNHKTSDAFEANDAAVRAIVVKTGEKKYDTLESLLKDYLAGLVSESSSYHNILTKFVSERYFRYTDADVENPPSGYDSLNVTTVPKNGTLGIPNNELIDITAIKTWDNDVSNKGAVEFTLYWSYTKSNNGIPNDATKATASDLGLTASAFENPKTVAVSDTGQSCTWENLPNGKFNGTVDRPIYYYIKETKYTVDNETYKLDETDNKFYKLESKDSDTFVEPKSEGAYQQFYTNNGINKSGEITVKNTKGLYVKKVWRTADNEALAADDIPVEYIKYVITGIGADGKRINIYEGTLTKDNNWTEAVPANELEGYTDFKVKEEIEEGQVEVLHGFNFSPNYNVTGSIGEITLVNKNNNPSVIDVTVNKEWSDGAETHTENPIKVWLYRTSRYLTSEELETLKNTRTLSAEGLSCERVTIDDVNEWTLNSANGWTETWEDLPYKGEINSNKVSRFYYYAVEKTDIDDYKATYSRNDQSSLQTLTIRNAIPGSLTLQKNWHDTSGNSIEAPADIDSIEVSLYKREKKLSSGDTSKLPTNQIKIMALGDSITDNYNNSEGSYRKYFYDVLVNTYHMNIDMVGSGVYWSNEATYAKSDGTIIKYDPNHEGHSGFFIENCIQGSGGLLEEIKPAESKQGKIAQYEPDIILLLIGTNDIMKDGAYSNLDYNMDQNEYEKRYTDLIDEIYSQKPNAIVFFMSPPPINSQDNGATDIVKDQDKMDRNVEKAINAIKKVVENQGNGKICRYVDLNTLFTNYSGGYKFLLDDYCHPNETGYELMGNFLAEEIVKYYGGSVTTSVPENVNGVPFDIKNGEYEFVDTYKIKKEDGWTLSIPDLPTKENGNDYVYYIVEESTGNWTAAYTGNGQIIGNEGATITVTNTIDKGSIEVEKVWKNHTPTNMDTVEVQLYRSTTKSPTDSELRTSSIMNEPMALAVDNDEDLPHITINQNLVEKKDTWIPLDDLGITNRNFTKVVVNVSKNDSGDMNFGLVYEKEKWDGIWKQNNDNFIEGDNEIFDNGNFSKVNYIIVNQIQKDIKINSITFYYPAGTEIGGGDTGGGDSGGGGGGATDPTQPQEGTSLDLQIVTDEKGGKSKTAVISNTLTLKVGNVITVNLKYSSDIDYINGCFGFNEISGEWCGDNTWGNNGIIPITDNHDGTATITWTIPDNFKSGNEIQFQIWYKNENVDSATYTIQNSTTTEPDTPTDSHIPTGAVAVGDPVELKTNHWTHTFDNLPLTDASGNPYYYYVKEVNVPNGFEVTYSDGVEPGEKITITNTKKESSTTTMPSTGGTGAGKYYTVGGMLLMLSACGWAMHRRKRVIPH